MNTAMRILALTAVAACAACANVSVPVGMTPQAAFQSTRTPVDLSGCITKAWSQHTSGISMVPDDEGFTLRVLHAQADADATVFVSKTDQGSAVRYAERIGAPHPSWMGGAVRSCK